MNYPYFEKVPLEYEANIRYRIELLEWTNGGHDRAERQRRRLQVWRACARDPLFFLSSFTFILEPRKRCSMPWVMYPFQVETLKKLFDAAERALSGEKIDVIQAKSRDMGASWMCCFVPYWYVKFRKNFSALLLSRKAELVDSHDPKSLFYKTDYLEKYLPKWLQSNATRTEMLWRNHDNDSFLKGESTNQAASVGDRVSMLLLDEFSLMDRQAQIWMGSRDVTYLRVANFTVRPWAHTANELMKPPKFGGENRIQIRLPWTDHPEKIAGLYYAPQPGIPARIVDSSYQFPENYRFRAKRQSGGGSIRSIWYDIEETRCANPFEMDTEVDMLETPGGHAFFNHDAVREMITEQASTPLHQGDILVNVENYWKSVLDLEDIDAPLSIWCPLSGGRPAALEYCVGVDIAAGSGASNSCASVWNRQTGEKVAEYVSPNIDPYRFAHKAIALCHLFSDFNGMPAFMKWERGGVGSVFGKEVVRAGFGNYYFQKNEHSLSGKQTDTPGWMPTPENRRTLLRGYAIAIVNKNAVNHSTAALEECLKYQDVEGDPKHIDEMHSDDPSGAKSNHGDRVVADALGFSEVNLENVQAVLASKSEKIDDTNLSTLAGRMRYHKFSEIDNLVKEDRLPWWVNYGKRNVPVGH